MCSIPPKSFFGTIKQLASRAEADGYTIVISRDAYKRLAIALLEKLADPAQARGIFRLDSIESVKADYTSPTSKTVATLRTLITNADLNTQDVQQVIAKAAEREQYEFAVAMREIAADLFPEAGLSTEKV